MVKHGGTKPKYMKTEYDITEKLIELNCLQNDGTEEIKDMYKAQIGILEWILKDTI